MNQTEKGWKEELKLSASDYKYVILTVIAGLVLAIISYISESFFTFIFATTYEIPVWAISLFLISFFLLLSHFLYQISSHKDNSDVEVVDDSKEEITKKDYKTDVIDSVKWEWVWFSNKIRSLKPLCPKCSYELDLKFAKKADLKSYNFDVYNGSKNDQSFSSTYAICKCGFSCAWYIHPDDVNKNTIKEIERRTRTPEYIEAVEKYS